MTDPPYAIAKDVSENDEYTDWDKYHNWRSEWEEWDKSFTMKTLNKFVKARSMINYEIVERSSCSATCGIDGNHQKMLERNNFKQIRMIECVKSNPQPRNSHTTYLANIREVALVAVKKGCPSFNSYYDVVVRRV